MKNKSALRKQKILERNLISLKDREKAEEKISSLFFHTISNIELRKISVYFSLKESLNVKKVYKLVDGELQKIELITGLNSGGYSEIIKGDIEVGDEVISKVIVETSNKKALRLF